MNCLKKHTVSGHPSAILSEILSAIPFKILIPITQVNSIVMKIFFHPVPWCASIEAWRSMWLLDPHGQVKTTDSYNHVIDMMGTLDAVHNFLNTFKV